MSTPFAIVTAVLILSVLIGVPVMSIRKEMRNEHNLQLKHDAVTGYIVGQRITDPWTSTVSLPGNPLLLSQVRTEAKKQVRLETSTGSYQWVNVSDAVYATAKQGTYLAAR